ncbi:MAG: 3-deoxy-manno-octulosonate cytidylyltransferase [Candidatus Goldbacteria bacterium]|nr:3-deoxy-manno-octulosonate cytidylyltransferase [Candidatus Goldiibacteriota bacterium]
MNVIGIIPARLKSTRLPEKMLVKINGRCLIEYVYLNALKCKSIKKLYVATDNVKIKNVIEKAGGNVIMTSKKCKSGTERICEAVLKLKLNSNDVIVNVQGDEPLLEPNLIDRTVKMMREDNHCDVVTLASPVKNMDEMNDTSVVKVVISNDGYALYFSRASIPFSRDGRHPNGDFLLKHKGLYTYRKGVLDMFPKYKSKYENVEKLEQLRILENGCKIKVVIAQSNSIGIDTKKDVEEFRKALNKRKKAESKA